jgi:polyisoprenoid-binding protein YceI
MKNVTMRNLKVFLACLTVAIALPKAPSELRAAPQPIDAQRSTVTIFVFKSGVFSAFADDHTIRARVASGSISADPPFAVEATIQTADLIVLDPGLSSSKRAEVQSRMLGPEVLDAKTYPQITFASAAIEPAGTDHWRVSGRLTIHGHTQLVTVPVAHEKGAYRGRVRIKQRDFGITPISIAGGTVTVKDELSIEFEIVPATGAE